MEVLVSVLTDVKLIVCWLPIWSKFLNICRVVTQTGHWVGNLDTGCECDWLLAQRVTR